LGNSAGLALTAFSDDLVISLVTGWSLCRIAILWKEENLHQDIRICTPSSEQSEKISISVFLYLIKYHLNVNINMNHDIKLDKKLHYG